MRSQQLLRSPIRREGIQGRNDLLGQLPTSGRRVCRSHSTASVPFASVLMLAHRCLLHCSNGKAGLPHHMQSPSTKPDAAAHFRRSPTDALMHLIVRVHCARHLRVPQTSLTRCCTYRLARLRLSCALPITIALIARRSTRVSSSIDISLMLLCSCPLLTSARRSSLLERR